MNRGAHQERIVHDAHDRQQFPSGYPLRSSPSGIIVLILFLIMVVQTVGMAAEGRKRFGSFGGAIMLMAASLGVVWNIIGSGLMFGVRKPVRTLARSLPLGPGLTFLFFATGLALLEEAITTTLTNLAPHFGNSEGFITASRNYLEVVLWHSVIVIAPMFAVWSRLLARYRFSPASVFLLFGANGVLAELLIGGNALVMAPFWIFVYGLMIFLPAYSYPETPGRAEPRWHHYPGAVLLCLAASAATALVVNLLSPHLPHFGHTLAYPK